MDSATLHFRVSPRRILKKAEAAGYCNMPVKPFANQCPIRPVQLNDSDLGYDIQDLDRWIERLKNGGFEQTDDEIIERLG